MKFAFGLLVCCILVIAATVLFAPEYAHEIIDKLNGNPPGPYIPHGDQNNTGDSHNNNDPGTTSEQDDGSGYIVEQPIPPKRIKHPRTKSELLTWLRENDFSVVDGQGFYRITLHEHKSFTSEPSAIVIRHDGTVSVRHEKPAVVDEDGAIVLGRNVRIKGSNASSTVTGEINGGLNGNIFINDISVSTSTKHENGNYIVDITRSFDWIPNQDSIENVWSKAKKIKGE